MTTKTTKAEKLADLAIAKDHLDHYREDITSGNALVMIAADYGKGLTDYFRVQIFYTGGDQEVRNSHLTWAIAKACGYTLRERNGYHFIAINGGNFSKTGDIADSLARFYGVDRIRFEQF